MTEDEAKRIFAENLIRFPDDPFKAGCAVYGMDTGSALRAATLWVQDADVKKYQAELLAEHGIAYFLPSKDEFAKGVYDFATTIRDPDNRIKALRLAAEVFGYIEKPGVVVNNNVDNRRVMIVKDHGSDSDWETKAAKQQKKLITDASASPAQKVATTH